MKNKLSVLLVLVLLAAVLSGCRGQVKKEKFSAYSFDYFDTVTTVTGYESSQEEFDRISGEVMNELAEYHRLFDIYHRYEGLENLCTLNDKKTAQVDGRIVELLLYCKEIYVKTDGKTNVAMGSVLSIWHDYREAGMDDPNEATLPPMEKLTEAAKHTNIDDVIIEGNTVTLADPEMRLDVGAVAKGYAVEMVARRLEEKGVSGYVLNVGGNVRTVGAKPNGERWEVGVESPEGDEYLARFAISDEAVVTSGSYQRFYIVGGKSYHHIIDPDTLMPADYFTSVSIRADSSADGDALSTALFCMSMEKGRAVAEAFGAEVLWCMKDGTVHKTEGFDK